MAKSDLIARQQGLIRTGVRDTQQRPHLGGLVPLPSPGGFTDVFTASVSQLSPVERAQPGWVLRVTTTDLTDDPNVDATGGWRMDALSVEVLSTAGGVQSTVELDIFPATQVFFAADSLQVRLKQRAEASPLVQPPDSLRIQWSLARGYAPTHAFRTQRVQADAMFHGVVPRLAKAWAWYLPQATLNPIDITADHVFWVFEFREIWGGRVLQRLSRADAFYAINAFSAVPPGAGYLRITNVDQVEWGDMPELRLVYSFGDLVQP